MSLLQYPPPVDYSAQLTGFKDFLKGFKTFQSSSEAAATEALEDLNIDEGRTSDEYDFMDDVDDEGANTRGARRRREPKLKYMQVLQDIANRDKSHILIELDDLATVSIPSEYLAPV
jgi:DNA replication licensing factor MCM7